MSNEKRLVLFVMLIFLWMVGFPYLLEKFGLAPPKNDAAKKPPVVTAKADEAKKAGLADAEKKPGDAPSAEPAAMKEAPKPKAELVPAAELLMGSAEDKAADGYRLAVQLDQKGAGVESVFSSRYDADFEGRTNPHLPMQLIGRDRSKPLFSAAWPPSLALTLSPADVVGRGTPMRPADRAKLAAVNPDAPPSEDLLDAELWDVVRDDQGRAVRPIGREAKGDVSSAQGQEVVFRSKAANGVVVTKTFRLWKGADGLELDLKFESPDDQERSFTFNLMGPYGIPIEGEWYTATFREVFFGTAAAGGSTALETETAYKIATGKAFESTVNALRYAGIENQYFAILVAPILNSTSPDDRIDRETQGVLLYAHPQDLQKSDVGVRISSRPVKVGPNTPKTFSFKVFAGAKTPEALAPYGAEELAVYRKGIIPLAPTIAKLFITPMLSFTYAMTERFSALFGGVRGNYGVAIILLTLIVKMLMFPLGRKQALMAQRMQELQPHLKAIQEKYKDDKEKLTRETFALYKKHNANPVAGCLPALIQLPIFVGLWQALNTTVGLRQAPFLWINDLAAPDMLFRMPFDLPFLGHWFNLLPILVVGLMLFQTQLFAPPATTPEAEMQQKTMKYMMIVMAVMFYKVPAGLGIYFITSSLWTIGERLLLPKIIHEHPAEGTSEGPAKGDDGPGRGPKGSPETPPKPPGGLAQLWNRVLEEAKKDPTYRKMLDERAPRDGRSKEKEKEVEKDRDRDRRKPPARPGRK